MTLRKEQQQQNSSTRNNREKIKWPRPQRTMEQSKRSNSITKVPKGEKKKWVFEKYWKSIWKHNDWRLPKLDKGTDSHIEKAEQTQNRIILKKLTSIHTISNLLKVKDKIIIINWNNPESSYALLITETPGFKDNNRFLVRNHWCKKEHKKRTVKSELHSLQNYPSKIKEK